MSLRLQPGSVYRTIEELPMSSDVEMRFSLLTEARAILFRHWEEKVYVEKATADFEQRAPKVVSPPTTRKIMKVAEELFGFVQGRIEVPRAPASAPAVPEIPEVPETPEADEEEDAG